MVQSQDSYSSFTKDITSSIEHIGEARPRNSDGTCPHQFLVPCTSNPTLCILPSRFDIGYHYLKSGGPGGYKEKFQQLLSRTLSFGKFFLSGTDYELQKSSTAKHFDLKKMPVLQALFASPSYLSSVSSICPAHETLDPFQLGIIIQLPGQQLGVHLDVPWFFGANRLLLPQWLLVVMSESHLFDDIRVHQIQGTCKQQKKQFASIGNGFNLLWMPCAMFRGVYES